MRTAGKRFRVGRGVILVISVLLFGSAVVRVIGPAKAWAEAQTPQSFAQEGTSETDESAATDRSATRAETTELLTALRDRERRVIKLENRIEIRSKALEVADAEIAKRLKKLEQAEAALRRTLALADGAAEDDLARLTTVYETMKPKDAAALFETMEPDFAAGFIGRMRPDAAAAVMTGLSPETAYTISVILAGRNAKAPKS